jgi:hypothetical protein
MMITLFGIVIDVRLLQPENALSPMLVTLLRIVEFIQPAINVFDADSIIALQFSRES